ncbi:TasA anchoring/assembly protein [Virgibacillus halotolerans]|nr:TasA anchoring/assembly protein [Virgibacillus halotolerans]
MNKFKLKNKGLIILLKVVLVWYVVLFSTSYLTSTTAANFTTTNQTENVIRIGDWEEPDGSLLKFVKKGNQNIKACDQSVEMKVTLKNTGTDMKSDSTYEVYHVENGNPEKQGTKVKLDEDKGNIQAVQSGNTIELVYKTDKPGTYVFLANQSNDDLKEQKTWSEWIKVHCPSDSKPKNTEEPKEKVKETNKEDSTSKEVKQESEEQQTGTNETEKNIEKDTEKENPEKVEKEDEDKQDAAKEKSAKENKKEGKTEMKAKTNGESKSEVKTKSDDNEQESEEE